MADHYRCRICNQNFESSKNLIAHKERGCNGSNDVLPQPGKTASQEPEEMLQLQFDQLTLQNRSLEEQLQSAMRSTISTVELCKRAGDEVISALVTYFALKGQRAEAAKGFKEAVRREQMQTNPKTASLEDQLLLSNATVQARAEAIGVMECEMNALSTCKTAIDNHRSTSEDALAALQLERTIATSVYSTGQSSNNYNFFLERGWFRRIPNILTLNMNVFTVLQQNERTNDCIMNQVIKGAEKRLTNRIERYKYYGALAPVTEQSIPLTDNVQETDNMESNESTR